LIFTLNKLDMPGVLGMPAFERLNAYTLDKRIVTYEVNVKSDQPIERNPIQFVF